MRHKRKGGTPPASSPGRAAAGAARVCCPQCRAEMGAADVLCLHCGYHKERGAQLRTVVIRHAAYGAPQDFRVEERRNRLVMSRGPALKGGLPWTLGVLALGLAVVGIVYHFQPIAGGAALALFLLVYLTAIYRLSIVVDPHRITVRHEPFFWPPKTIRVEDIDQLYCRKRSYQNRSERQVHTYDVCVLTKAGRRRRIVSHLHFENHALFFEERIERFLGITDRPVEESFLETYYGVFYFLLVLALAILTLVISLILR